MKLMSYFLKYQTSQRKLATLKEVGLGYIKLGQQSPTLSGGEAQRVKLATQLSKRSTGKTLYLLDEPTTGLHFDDVRILLKMLDNLVEKTAGRAKKGPQYSAKERACNSFLDV